MAPRSRMADPVQQQRQAEAGQRRRIAGRDPGQRRRAAQQRERHREAGQQPEDRQMQPQQPVLPRGEFVGFARIHRHRARRPHRQRSIDQQPGGPRRPGQHQVVRQGAVPETRQVQPVQRVAADRGRPAPADVPAGRARQGGDPRLDQRQRLGRPAGAGRGQHPAIAGGDGALAGQHRAQQGAQQAGGGSVSASSVTKRHPPGEVRAARPAGSAPSARGPRPGRPARGPRPGRPARGPRPGRPPPAWRGRDARRRRRPARMGGVVGRFDREGDAPVRPVLRRERRQEARQQRPGAADRHQHQDGRRRLRPGLRPAQQAKRHRAGKRRQRRQHQPARHQPRRHDSHPRPCRCHPAALRAAAAQGCLRRGTAGGILPPRMAGSPAMADYDLVIRGGTVVTGRHVAPMSASAPAASPRSATSWRAPTTLDAGGLLRDARRRGYALPHRAAAAQPAARTRRASSPAAPRAWPAAPRPSSPSPRSSRATASATRWPSIIGAAKRAMVDYSFHQIITDPSDTWCATKSRRWSPQACAA